MCAGEFREARVFDHLSSEQVQVYLDIHYFFCHTFLPQYSIDK